MTSRRTLYSEENNTSKRSPSTNRSCTVCKKKPIQVQCYHCYEPVCMECAQIHVNLVTQESDSVVHLLNEKIDALDSIAIHTGQRIVAERDKIVKRADAERDQALELLAEMIEEEKQQIRNKSKELNDLPLNEIPPFISQIQSEPRLTDEDDTLFNVSSSMPQITIQRRKEQVVKETSASKPLSRLKYDETEDKNSTALTKKDTKPISKQRKSVIMSTDMDESMTKELPASKRDTYSYRLVSRESILHKDDDLYD